jgi:ADP-ribosyl-[dinitrogen reductase] hydrolase
MDTNPTLIGERIDKVTGCILGGAIGDALGGPYEGAAPPIEINDTTPWGLSDDTQLTLATCKAIAGNEGVADPSAIAACFALWHRERRVTGMGTSTYKALSELAQGGHWALVGRKGEYAAGNGAAMRAAPLAFCLDPAEPADRQRIRDVSRITHHSEEAYAGALAVVKAVRAATSGVWKGGDNLIDSIIGVLPDSAVKDRVKELANLGADRSLAEIAERCGASGYVAESVPLALYAAQKVERLGFEKMLTELIRVGGDTDTNASIAGQISGAYLGIGGLPVMLLAKLPEKSLVESIARQFAEKVTR